MWYQERDEGVMLFVKIIPRARRNEIVGPLGDFLKIKIAAPAESGRANDELLGYLADLLGVAKSSVRLVRGRSNPLKLIFVPAGIDQVRQLIQPRKAKK
ncbi:MAG: DUF167 domain-containing protein [Patescibacteria group bacterium]|jgi:hypothetical protein